VDETELSRLVRRVLAVFADDLNDADNPLLIARMIEEAEIALLHFLHIFRGLPVAHAAPRLALGAPLLLHVPGKCLGCGFEQPIGHVSHSDLRGRASSRSAASRT